MLNRSLLNSQHYAEGKCLAGEQCHFAHIGEVPIREQRKKDMIQSHKVPEADHDQAAKRERTRKSKKKTSRIDDIQIITSA